MSDNNALKFLQKMNHDESLFYKVIDGCSSAASWVSAAAMAGFETTIDELRSTCERLVGRPIKAETLVGELRSLFAAELDEEQLAGATGGALPLYITRLPPRLIGLPDIVGLHIKDSGPTWVNSPTHLLPIIRY